MRGTQDTGHENQADDHVQPFFHDFPVGAGQPDQQIREQPALYHLPYAFHPQVDRPPAIEDADGIILIFDQGRQIQHRRKRQTGYSLYRRALSAFNRLVNEVFLGFNLEDVNWVKIYKTQELRKLDLQLKSSLVESEICAKLIWRGATFIQTPSIYHRRSAGVARGGGSRTLLKALSEVVRLARILKDEEGFS